MLRSLVSVSSLHRIRNPAMAAFTSSMFSKAAPCCSGHASMWLCSSISSASSRGLLHSHTLPSIWTSMACERGLPLFRRSHSHAQAQHKRFQLNTKVLEKPPARPEKILYTYKSEKETVLYNIIAFVMFGALSYGSYLIYISEDYEVVNTIPPDGDFPVFYKRYDLNPYRDYFAAGVLVAAFASAACILRHTLRCVRSLVLLQDGETLAVSTYTLFGSTKTRNVPRLHLRTEQLNYLLSDYESCFLMRRGQLISYILDVKGIIHDPATLKAIFAHSDDDIEVPPSERRV